MGSASAQRGNDRNSGYDREEHDWYVEPRIAIDALLDVEPIHGTVLDPACGGGNIPQACIDRGIPSIGSDIADRGYALGAPHFDFFDYPDDARVENIISNPPFNVIEAWIEKSLVMARYKVCILARLAILEGQKRRRLFLNTPLARVWVFSSRISMPPGGAAVPAKNGSVAYCWLVWEHGHNGKPNLGWL